jgi:hypothetical protein|tara:strand:- start:112 stop:714 length:603 start_codon:yes stop_codon:yes gene_type:complete
MLAIGNGESRASIDIDKINGPKVGCNALWRDYHTDYLVCVDRRMVDESVRGKVNLNDTLIYTREDWYDRYQRLPKVRKLPPLPYNGEQRWDEPFQWGSGPYAVFISALFAKEGYVNLIGFDLWSNTKQVNNIYKDSPNYDDANKSAVDPRYWLHQIGMVFNCFPKIQFTVYQTPSWELPKAWNYSNVSVDTLSNISYNNT